MKKSAKEAEIFEIAWEVPLNVFQQTSESSWNLEYLPTFFFVLCYRAFLSTQYFLNRDKHALSTKRISVKEINSFYFKYIVAKISALLNLFVAIRDFDWSRGSFGQLPAPTSKHIWRHNSNSSSFHPPSQQGNLRNLFFSVIFFPFFLFSHTFHLFCFASYQLHRNG